MPWYKCNIYREGTGAIVQPLFVVLIPFDRFFVRVSHQWPIIGHVMMVAELHALACFKLASWLGMILSR